ncbi:MULTISPECIES: phage tail tape measure protein [unclassified Chelatococcus]|uniref:phage tail tape measure protein n=1 Tax=unclassified Chelatococcus TaxID=2638111 RepID=UPI001BD03E5E|nr:MULTISPECIES: phage tail tape measure protein [unclassified Chelatococcus]CAH1669550.1 Lambda family phage tail tape measure protein [Hyphomicrobiales bacterium]MBS7739321.1 phage tail tape measure protein [Chelatococcus sp. HY11]MBX3546600.1 phage tail tape measure protein [Chelatococcus sp.]MCO5076145.1 phage tail tape measure protein [Chelatococcus sp.]CAH1679000.1 Lambda family phage tail tape measure protein [Hyphomicrobiales bacterium]
MADGYLPDDDPVSLANARDALKDLDSLSRQFGRSISDSFAKAATGSRQFDDVLRTVGSRLTEIGLKAALRPLGKALTSGLESLVTTAGGSLFGGLSLNAKGNAFSQGRVQPFADGGVVATPTYFPMQRGVGLMGESGPEAILPLARGPDGRLGVAASGGGTATSIVVNIAASDAESFRRSEAQVSAALARAVARGQRAL